MDIKTFLNSSAGEWFTQRTNYDLDGSKTENSKAHITVEFIEPDNPQTIALCQQNKIEPNLSLGGLKYSWDNSVDWGKTKQQGNALIILVPDHDNPQTGKIFKTSLAQNNASTIGRYILGKDEALTLIIETENIYAEERQWFAGENLRLRTTVIKDGTGNMQTSFYSEIRRLAPKEQSSSKDAVAS